MPKIKDSDDIRKEKMFKGLVAKNMAFCGYRHNNELAPAMHMHERTLNYKLNDPNKFTFKELKLLFKTLKFTEEDKHQII